MDKFSCSLEGNEYDRCERVVTTDEDGEEIVSYNNWFTEDVMVDPVASVTLSYVQETLMAITMDFEAYNPDTGELQYNYSRTKYRQAGSFYEDY